VSQPLAAKLGQTVIIENLPGAGGRIGAKAVAQASPDGYTLLLGGTNPNAIAQSIYNNSLNFEPIRDFTAVGVIGVDSNALVVNPASRQHDPGAHPTLKGKPGKTVGRRHARHRSACDSGAAQGPNRRQHAVRALSGGGPCNLRLAGQSNSNRHDHQGSASPPHQGRQAEGARRNQ
jgi:Tripartite tricarboxylate transporter family receptor